MIGQTPLDMQQLAAEVARHLLNEHKSDGKHANVTADRLTMNGPIVLSSKTPDGELSATIANYARADLGSYSVFRLKASGALSIRGIVPAVVNQLLFLRNLSSNDITLEHEDTAATANYRFQLPNSADVVLGQYDGVMLWYDDASKRWTCFQQ